MNSSLFVSNAFRHCKRIHSSNLRGDGLHLMMSVRTVQRAQGLPITVAEEIAFENGWITRDQLMDAAVKYGKSPYGKHLKDVAEDKIIIKSRE